MGLLIPSWLFLTENRGVGGWGQRRALSHGIT